MKIKITAEYFNSVQEYVFTLYVNGKLIGTVFGDDYIFNEKNGSISILKNMDNGHNVNIVNLNNVSKVVKEMK